MTRDDTAAAPRERPETELERIGGRLAEVIALYGGSVPPEKQNIRLLANIAWALGADISVTMVQRTPTSPAPSTEGG